MKGLRRDRARRHRDLDALREALAPFVPERLSRGNVGVRVAAYLLDTSVPLLTVSAANVGATLLRGYRFGTDRERLRLARPEPGLRPRLFRDHRDVDRGVARQIPDAAAGLSG